MKAARQSLIYRGDAATGWSLGWKINLWARFKEGNHAYKLIQMLLSFVLDIKWKDGKLQRLIVTSKAGMSLTLRYNSKVVTIPTTKNGIYNFDASLNKL